MVQYCCVPGCKTKATDPNARFHHFPFRNKELVLKWECILGIQRKASKAMVVCARHFGPEDYRVYPDGYQCMRRPLRPNALPSQNLPTPGDLQLRKFRVMRENLEAKQCSLSSGQNKKSKLKSLSAPSQKLSGFSEPKASNKIAKATVVSSKSPKKTCTTNRPIITVVKAEDVNGEKPVTTDNSETQLEGLKIKIRPEVDSDAKLSPVSDGAPKDKDPSSNQDEKRKNFKENNRPKKRSSSVGSNSSSGSVETTKSVSSPKRRKIEKPPPTVSGRDNDCYCWVCHKEGIVLCCISCPRAYHLKCAGEFEDHNDWVCVECRRILNAENVDSRSTTLSKISLNKLCALLKLSLNKIKYRAPAAFHQPVPVEYYPSYPEYVIHPIDLSIIEKNIKQKMYGCTESFLADIRWILHNSSVFNGTQHPLSTNAKSLVKSCEYDMGEIEVCPDCYMHSCIRSKYWFSDVCNKPHPLVWAKLKGFPYWPAKVVRIVDQNVDARFFGAHDRAWVSVSQCYHLSKEMPTSSKPKKKGTYDAALDELNVHVQLLIQKFGNFVYAPYRTPFDPENTAYSYHGIDIDKIIQMEDDSFDPASINFKQLPVSSVSASVDVIKQDEPKLTLPQEIPFPDTVESKPEKPPSPKFSSNLSPVEKQPSVEKKIPPVGVFEVSSKVHLETPQKLGLLSAPLEIKLSPAAFTNNNQKIVSALERIKEIVSNELDPDEESKPLDSSTEDKKSELNSSKSSDLESKEIDKDVNISSESATTNSKPQDDNSDYVELSCSNSSVVAPALPLKKSDLFAMKLDKTIESCKAKLGITEISEQETSGSESAEEEEEEDSEEESDNESVTSEIEEVIDVCSDSTESEVESKSESSDVEMDVTDDVETSGTSGGKDVHSGNVDSSPKKMANDSEEDVSVIQKHLGLPLVSDEIMDAVSNSCDADTNDGKEVGKENSNECQPLPVVTESPTPKGTDSGLGSLSPTNHDDSPHANPDDDSPHANPDDDSPHANPDDSHHASNTIIEDVSERCIDESGLVAKENVFPTVEKTSPKISSGSTVCTKEVSDNHHKESLSSIHLQNIIKKMQGELHSIKQSLSSLKVEFKKQQWFHTQEKSELHHNMCVMMMEMRASLETDKKQAIESLKKQHEVEKKKACEEIKKRQWCANCKYEAVFFCCRNTNYCSVSCQRLHWISHMHQCKRSRPGMKTSANAPSDISRIVNGKLDRLEVPESQPMDKKVIFLSVKPSELVTGKIQSSSSPVIPSTLPGDVTMDLPSQSQSVASQIQFVASNSPLQIISSNSKLPSLSAPSYQAAKSSALQFLLSPIPSSSDTGNVVCPEIVRAVQDSTDIITKVRSRQTDLGTAIELLKEMNKEAAASLPKEIKSIVNPEDTPEPSTKANDSLEMDGLSSSEDENYDESAVNEEESVNENHASGSDSDDEVCETVSLAEGVEVKGKALKKCRRYGTTAARLTRLLINVLFPDLSLLAKSSVYCHKDRPALPSKEVQAIIDYVKFQFPDCDQKDIVFQMKIKCKEARMMLRRAGLDSKSQKPKNESTSANIDAGESSQPEADDSASNCVSKTPAAVTSMLRERLSVRQSPLQKDANASTSSNVLLEDTKNITNKTVLISDIHSSLTVPGASHNSLNGFPLSSVGSFHNYGGNQGSNTTESSVSKTRLLRPKTPLINTLPITSSMLPVGSSTNVKIQHSRIIGQAFQPPAGSTFVTTDLTNLQHPSVDHSNPHPVLVLGSTLSAALQFGSKSSQMAHKKEETQEQRELRLAKQREYYLKRKLKETEAQREERLKKVRLKIPASGASATNKLTNSQAAILPSLLHKGTGESSGIS